MSLHLIFPLSWLFIKYFVHDIVDISALQGSQLRLLDSVGGVILFVPGTVCRLLEDY